MRFPKTAVAAIANHDNSNDKFSENFHIRHNFGQSDPYYCGRLRSLGWDKAGNAPQLTAVDPVTGVSVTFPDLDVPDELLKTNLIMPEPCPFLDRSLLIVSIIRPTKTEGAAMGALRFLANMGLFIGQSPGSLPP
jgi:hypothetical protein